MTPPDSVQHNVYCALPGPIRRRSLVSAELTNSAAPGPRTRRLAEVADVEQPDGVAGRGVLADRARVRDRHQPAAELGEARAEFAVAVLERALLQIVAHGDPP